MGDLSILVAVAEAVDFVETLSSPGPFTVFAPTNEAWKKLGTSLDYPPQNSDGTLGPLSPTLDVLLKPENKAQLLDILKYHILPIECRSQEPPDSKNPPSTNCQAGSGIWGVSRLDTLLEGQLVTTFKSGDNPGQPPIPSKVVSTSPTTGKFLCNWFGDGVQDIHSCPSVVGVDNLATNGVVHIVDKVLLIPDRYGDDRDNNPTVV